MVCKDVLAEKSEKRQAKSQGRQTRDVS
jgi:hypothetical protein